MARDDESRPREDLGFLCGDDPGTLNKFVRPDVESSNGDILDDLDNKLEDVLEYTVVEDSSFLALTEIFVVGGGVKSDDILFEGD